jgi:hypothetical protein
MKKKQTRDSTCKAPKTGRLAPFYLNGDLSEDEMRKMQTHLYDCAECRESLRFLKTAQDLNVVRMQTS